MDGPGQPTQSLGDPAAPSAPEVTRRGWGSAYARSANTQQGILDEDRGAGEVWGPRVPAAFWRSRRPSGAVTCEPRPLRAGGPRWHTRFSLYAPNSEAAVGQSRFGVRPTAGLWALRAVKSPREPRFTLYPNPRASHFSTWRGVDSARRPPGEPRATSNRCSSGFLRRLRSLTVT